MLRIYLLLVLNFLNSNENNINKKRNSAYINFINKTLLNQNFSNKNKERISFKKNLLIGSVVNYNWKKVAPFFKSFKQANFKNCDCIIFVGNMKKNTINKIQSFGVLTLDIPLEKFKNMKIINYRWKLYSDFLQKNLDKYNLVFTADIRDTIFQQDVFDFLPNNKSFLGIALEDGTLSRIRNKYWIINAYGKDIHKTLEKERIICIGTLWGTVDIFLNFSKIMYKKLSSEWSLKNKVIEQAVTNYLIYYEKLFNDFLIKSENKDGKIMTIGLTKKKNIFLDLDKNILNLKGEKAAVIHQYDRKPYITNLIINKYCPEINNIKRKRTYNFLINNKTSFINKDIVYKNINNINALIKMIFEIRKYLKLIITLFLILILLLIIILVISKKKFNLDLPSNSLDLINNNTIKEVIFLTLIYLLVLKNSLKI